ncbi:MAG: hypothetical protein IPJ20_13665 [Flammeovirgaceae bacterium]|nr:hypothetical protein [Flammeovirgaceae bacterium]
MGGKAYYHYSFDNFSDKDAYSAGGYASYSTRTIFLETGFIALGKNFNAESGFVPNTAVYPGSVGAVLNCEYKIYQKSGPIVVMSPGFHMMSTTCQMVHSPIEMFR